MKRQKNLINQFHTSLKSILTYITKIWIAFCFGKPDHEPKVTENIDHIITMIEKILNNKNAYINEKHVLFDVNSYKNYGQLSNRNKDEMLSGARVEVQIIRNIQVILFYGSLQATMNQDGIVLGDMEDLVGI